MVEIASVNDTLRKIRVRYSWSYTKDAHKCNNENEFKNRRTLRMGSRLERTWIEIIRKNHNALNLMIRLFWIEVNRNVRFMCIVLYLRPDV